MKDAVRKSPEALGQGFRDGWKARERQPDIKAAKKLAEALKMCIDCIERWNNGEPVKFGDAFDVATTALRDAGIKV